MYREGDTDLQNILHCETFNKPAQLIGLLNANLDFWFGTTVQVVCTKYEISKWKLYLSLTVRSKSNVQGMCCVFSDITQEYAKILVFVNISSSYVKFKFQKRWLWRILSSVTAWPLKIGPTVCPEKLATNYHLCRVIFGKSEGFTHGFHREAGQSPSFHTASLRRRHC
jgi:hypothetical protein